MNYLITLSNHTPKKLIITLTHNICNPGETREEKVCDIKSWEFADRLHEIYQNSVIIKSEINRRKIDPNRFFTGSRSIVETNFYKKLKKEIKSQDLVIFDIHSFPKKDDLEFYIIDNATNQEFVEGLYQKFSKIYNKRVGKKYGPTGKNFVLDLFSLHPLYIPVVLLEIHDKMEESQMKEISEIIKTYILA